MEELLQLGYRRSEIHPAAPSWEKGFFLTHSIGDTRGYFRISTEAPEDISLTEAFTRACGLEPLRREDGQSFYSIPETKLLGLRSGAMERPAASVSTNTNVFGTIGRGFYSSSVLALDPAGPHAALSSRDFHPTRHGFFELPVTGPPGVPTTTGFSLKHGEDLPLTTLVSTDAPKSYLTDRARKLLPKRAIRSGVIRLPDGTELALRADLRVPFETGVDSSEVESLDLILGLDILCGFLTILDFRRRAIGLRPYPGAVK